MTPFSLLFLIFSTSPPFYYNHGPEYMWIYKSYSTELLIHPLSSYYYFSYPDSINHLVIPLKSNPDSVKVWKMSLWYELGHISESVYIPAELPSCGCVKDNLIFPIPHYREDITSRFLLDIVYANSIDTLLSILDSLGYKIHNKQESLFAEYIDENFNYFLAIKDTVNGYYYSEGLTFDIYFQDSIPIIPILALSYNKYDFYVYTLWIHRMDIESASLLYAERFSRNEIDWTESHLPILYNFLWENSFLTSSYLDTVPLFISLKRAEDDREFQRIIYAFMDLAIFAGVILVFFLRNRKKSVGFDL